jgi:hypothetical protein
MEWTEKKTGESVEHVLQVNAKSWDDFASGVSACLARIAGLIPQCYAKDEWNRLYCEIWLDSGHVLLFPGKQGFDKGSRRCAVRLVCPFVKQKREELPESDLESKSRDLRGVVARYFGRGLEVRATKKALRELRKENDYKLMYQQGSDEGTAGEFFFA